MKNVSSAERSWIEKGLEASKKADCVVIGAGGVFWIFNSEIGAFLIIGGALAFIGIDKLSKFLQKRKASK